MIFRTIKDIAIVILLASSLAGCAQLFGNSDPNSPGSADPSVDKGATHHKTSQDKSRQNHLFSYSGDDPSDSNGSSFFGGSGGDFWQHLRHDFQLLPADNESPVQSQINWFMHNKEYLNHTLVRSEPYMYYILQQVEKRDLPGELALIPVEESAYNPTAISSAGAVGMWQLMRSTARDLGVKQDFWFDGRRDIYASTNAALDEMMYLQSFFGGDWLLAIAAYNSGPGTVQSAIRRNAMRGEGSEFWVLPLPQQTRSYVPRLLALASIIRNPEKYGITLPAISDKPYLTQVDIGAPISLSRAAELAGLSLAQIKQLNPGYSRMMTDPNGPYKLIIPIDKVETFKEQLASVPKLPKMTWGRYKVQHKDTLTSIAAHYHTTVKELIETNHLHGHHVPTGTVIMIPTGTEEVTPHVNETDSEENTNTHTETSTETNTETNIEGTTNSDKANVETTPESAPAAVPNDENTPPAKHKQSKTSSKKTHTSHHSKTEKTHGKKPVKHNTKQSLHKSAIRPNHYVIKSGDTLSGIAKKLGVKATNLTKWNHLAANTHLKPNERLVVY